MNVNDSGRIILHIDLGSKYRGDQFGIYLAKKKIHNSFSRKGCHYVNFSIASFYSVLEKDEVHLKVYKDYEDAYESIFEYIESWYNH